MRKILLSVFVAQTLIANAHGKPVVEDLAPAKKNIAIGYLWTKAVYSAGKALIRSDDDGTYLMTPHTSPVDVMTRVETTPIFWGTSWSNPKFYSDKFYGLLYWYNNFQNSTYGSTVNEYLPFPLYHSLSSPIIDASPANSDPNAVLVEICNAVGYISNSQSGYFPVYSDIPRGSASYCSFHAAGTCNGVPVQFAFFFNLDDDPECDPGSPYAPQLGTSYSQKPGSIAGIRSAYQQSQGLAALANVSAHELAETVTDPAYFPPNSTSVYWGGWYDIVGDEMGDKCAWTFGPSSSISNAAPGTVTIGRILWKLQGEWSNNAQNAGSGYPTQNGQLFGCMAGS